MTPTRLTAVIVVNYGSSHLLGQHLPKLRLGETSGSSMIVVVDNYSDDDERRAVSALCTSNEWVLVESDNAGFGAGMNAGVAAAEQHGADHVLLLNPDAWIDPAAVDELVRRSAEDPRALISPVIERPDGTIWFRGASLDLHRGRTVSRPPVASASGERFWLTAACLMTSVEAWRLLGGFDEEYFLYWEDVDLSARAEAAGLRLEVCDDLLAVHDQGGTQQGSRHSHLSWAYYRYNIRNRLLYAAKHLDDRQWRSWLRHTPRESYRILLRGGGKRIFLSPVMPLRVAIGAIAEGIRSARRIRANRGS